MKDIERTITVSVCFGKRVNVNGEWEDFTEDMFRAITPQRATKYLRNKYRDETIVVNKVESDTSTYVLPFSEFLKYAYVRED